MIAGQCYPSKLEITSYLPAPGISREISVAQQQMTVHHLTEHCKRRSNAQKASTVTALAAQNSRGFRVGHDHARGTVHFSIELPVEEGELKRWPQGTYRNHCHQTSPVVTR